MTDTPYPLGRHVNHDPKSWDHPAPRTVAGPQTVVWRHHGAILNQKRLGSCVGNAVAQALMTTPNQRAGRYVTEKTAVQLYSAATLLDDSPGSYPPDDTGSSGLAACKAAQQAGYITSYLHAFGLDHAKTAITAGPLMCGTNWYEQMFKCDPTTGEVTIGGQVAGGHEWLLLGFLANDDKWVCLNSWGLHWGIPNSAAHCRGGVFTMSSATLGRLLSEQGDLTQPVP